DAIHDVTSGSDLVAQWLAIERIFWDLFQVFRNESVNGGRRVSGVFGAKEFDRQHGPRRAHTRCVLCLSDNSALQCGKREASQDEILSPRLRCLRSDLIGRREILWLGKSNHG